jgi:hypothetical protein
LGGARSQVRDNPSFAVVFGHNLYRLDAILQVSASSMERGFTTRMMDVRKWLFGILGEHGNHNVIHHFNFCLIRRGDFHEDIPRV